MKSIIERMYGDVYGNGGKPADVPYYNTFGYFSGRGGDTGTSPASESGPTAQQLMQSEGMLDENGYLRSNPNVHSNIAAMYGGAPALIDPSNNAMNPAYEAALQGDTMGGIGNTDGWGNDILWSTPNPNNGTYGTLKEGDIFQTPAGNYKVITNPWGQLVLQPEDGAPAGVGPYVTNITNGEHHLGINPSTGEVWYQQASGYSNFSGGDYYQNPQAPVAPNSPANASGVSTPGVGTSSGGDSTTAGSAKAPLAKSSWLDVLNRQGRDLESWDPYLGTFTGLSQNPDWTQMNAQQAQDSFNNIWNQGLFSGLSQADVYADLLKRLGFGV